MIPLIFGILIFALIFYSIKAKDEKKLREDREFRHKMEVDNLNCELKKERKNKKAEQQFFNLINFIRDNEVYNIKDYKSRKLTRIYERAVDRNSIPEMYLTEFNIDFATKLIYVKIYQTSNSYEYVEIEGKTVDFQNKEAEMKNSSFVIHEISALSNDSIIEKFKHFIKDLQ